MLQAMLPEEYRGLSRREAEGRIARVKKELGERLVILGHHYQRDEVIQFADYRGDSLKLSQLAAEAEAEFVVFCGVHFMAESADVLSGAGQTVVLPDLSAGCPMADMARPVQVRQCWDALEGSLGGRRVWPVTYVNSSAAIKAFCGEREGLCCTSGNAKAVLEYLWGKDAEGLVLFLPDQHLGRNTGYALGRSLDSMVLWDPYEKEGGLSAEQLGAASMVLWDGFCSVHQLFTAEQIERARALRRGVKVVVHPECRWEVVQAADEVGSTEGIIRLVGESAAGTEWLVGTESHLVERLAAEHAGRGVKVESLSTVRTPCETMSRIDLGHLAWVMEAIGEHVASGGKRPLVNVVKVEEKVKAGARKALEGMLALGRGGGGA